MWCDGDPVIGGVMGLVLSEIHSDCYRLTGTELSEPQLVRLSGCFWPGETGSLWDCGVFLQWAKSFSKFIYDVNKLKYVLMHKWQMYLLCEWKKGFHFGFKYSSSQTRVSSLICISVFLTLTNCSPTLQLLTSVNKHNQFYAIPNNDLLEAFLWGFIYILLFWKPI